MEVNAGDPMSTRQNGGRPKVVAEETTLAVVAENGDVSNGGRWAKLMAGQGCEGTYGKGTTDGDTEEVEATTVPTEDSETTVGRGEDTTSEGPGTTEAKAANEETPESVVAGGAVTEAGKAATEDILTNGDVVTTDEAILRGISELVLSPAKLLLVSRGIFRFFAVRKSSCDSHKRL